MPPHRTACIPTQVRIDSRAFRLPHVFRNEKKKTQQRTIEQNVKRRNYTLAIHANMIEQEISGKHFWNNKDLCIGLSNNCFIINKLNL